MVLKIVKCPGIPSCNILNKGMLRDDCTSRPMMATAGKGRSQGPTLASAAIGGLVHSNTNVVATINCTNQAIIFTTILKPFQTIMQSNSVSKSAFTSCFSIATQHRAQTRTEDETHLISNRIQESTKLRAGPHLFFNTNDYSDKIIPTTSPTIIPAASSRLTEY